MNITFICLIIFNIIKNLRNTLLGSSVICPASKVPFNMNHLHKLWEEDEQLQAALKYDDMFPQDKMHVKNVEKLLKIPQLLEKHTSLEAKGLKQYLEICYDFSSCFTTNTFLDQKLNKTQLKEKLQKCLKYFQLLHKPPGSLSSSLTGNLFFQIETTVSNYIALSTFCDSKGIVLSFQSHLSTNIVENFFFYTKRQD